MRILKEWLCDADARYIDAAGTSDEEKPTGVITGSKFREVDTGKLYRYSETDGKWYPQFGGEEEDET